MVASLIDDVTANGKLFLESGDDAARQKIIAAASALIQQLENPGEQLARIGWGEPTRTAAFRTAFELGIFQKLGETPQDSKQLTEGTKADSALIARILKHLAANGIIKEVGQDQYVGTPFSGATNDPTISAGLIYSFEGMIPTFNGLPEFLAKTDYQTPHDSDNGPVQFGLRTDKPFFGVLQENQRLGSAFNNFMTGYAKVRPRWVDFYPVKERLVDESQSTGTFLVDVGGGLGHELTDLHKKHTDLPGQLVLQDLPSVISEAQSSATLPSAIKAVAHDFFEPQPAEYSGARAYFMRLVLHDWPDAKCAAILSNLRQAMKEGYSKLLINETVLRDTGAPWQQTSLDMTMLSMLISKERTESQWKNLLEAAGLKISGIWTEGNENVIEAVVA